jgi:hypothetical protein
MTYGHGELARVEVRQGQIESAGTLRACVVVLGVAATPRAVGVRDVVWCCGDIGA